MFDLLSKIGAFLHAVFMFVKMLIEGILNFITYIGTIGEMLPKFTMFFPAVLATGVVAIISIALVYKILSRSN